MFALFGEDAEKAHDALDWALVDIGAHDVLTSWHHPGDHADMATFVVACMKSMPLERLLVVVNMTDRQDRLRESLVAAITAWR